MTQPALHPEPMTPAAVRSMLYVPGSTPERFPKALASAADLICLDLEDGVAPEKKSSARSNVLSYVFGSADRDRLCVRLNRLASVEGLEDAAALIRAPTRPGFVMLPKVESPRDTELLGQTLAIGPPCHLLAMIESPRGLEAAFDIARAEHLSMLVFGSFDYAAETGCLQEWSVLLPVRSRIVAAAASAGKLALDSPFAGLDDLPGAAAEARLVQSLGFSGKSTIHPKFVADINAAFTPTDEELTEARAIVEAFTAAGGGALRIGDRFIEAPVARRMQRRLDRAALAHTEPAADGDSVQPSTNALSLFPSGSRK